MGSGMKVCRPQQPTVWTTWRGRSGTSWTQLQRQRHHRLVALGGARTLSCWKLFRWLPLHYPSVQGAPAEKLTVGMPTFGHGWELMDESEVIYWNRTIWCRKYFPRTGCSAWQQETAHAGRTLGNLASSDITRSCKLSTMTRESGKLLLEYCQKIDWDDVLHSFKIYTVCLGCLEQLLRLGRQLWMDAILLHTSQMDLGEWTTKNNHHGAQEIWTSQATSFRWVGYDDVDSIRLKAQFVNSRGLAGSMIW